MVYFNWAETESELVLIAYAERLGDHVAYRKLSRRKRIPFNTKTFF